MVIAKGNICVRSVKCCPSWCDVVMQNTQYLLGEIDFKAFMQ